MDPTNGPCLEALEHRLLLDGELPVDLHAPDLVDEGSLVPVWFDGFTTEVSWCEWAITKDDQGYDPGPQAVSDVLMFTPTEEGTYHVNVSVTDVFGFTGTDVMDIVVQNVAPKVTLSSGAGPILLPNGDFSGSEGLAGWVVIGDGTAEVKNGQLHLGVDTTIEWTGTKWVHAGGQAQEWIYRVMPDELGNFTPPLGATGVTFDVVEVTVQAPLLPQGMPGAWLTAIVDYWTLLEPRTAYFGSGASGVQTITIPQLTGADPLSIQLMIPDLMFWPPSVPAIDGHPTYNVLMDVYLDNFAWAGTCTAPEATGNVGVPLTFTAAVQDPGATDTFIYAWTVNSVLTSSQEALTFTPGAPGTYEIGLTVKDNDGGQTLVSQTVTVVGGGPILTLAGPPDGIGVRGEDLGFTLQAGDPEAGGFTYTINWGDGTPLETVVGLGVETVSHTYSGIGTFTVQATVTSGGVTSPPAAASVDVVRAVVRDGELIAVGTGSADRIRVSTGAGGITVSMDEDGDGAYEWSATYAPAGVAGISLSGGAGNDLIIVESGVVLLAELYGGDGNDVIYGGGGDNWLYGGAGNDALYGGPGHNVIYGGDGNDIIAGGAGSDILFGGNGVDVISGGTGNDFLIGGDGTDLLLGNAGHDILVAGEVDPSYTVEDLRGILADWASQRDPDEGLVDDEEEPVADDNFDVLTGGTGNDWFIINRGDWVLDFRFNWTQRDLITYI